MRKDNAYLEDILEAAKSVRRFISGISLEDFKSNEEKYEAVNRKFEIIGEPPADSRPKPATFFPKFHGSFLRRCETFSFTTMMMWTWTLFGIRHNVIFRR